MNLRSSDADSSSSTKGDLSATALYTPVCMHLQGSDVHSARRTSIAFTLCIHNKPHIENSRSLKRLILKHQYRS